MVLLAACGRDAPTTPRSPSSPTVSRASEASAETQFRTLDEKFEHIDELIGGFGGLYYDRDKRPHVFLVDASHEARARSTLLEQFPSLSTTIADFVVEKGAYSWRQLTAWRALLLQDGVDRSGLLMDDIDDRTNRLYLGVKDAATGTRLVGALVDEGVPREAIVTEVIEPASLLAQSVNDTINPVVGGMQISGGQSCTLGFNVRYNSVMHFATVSHCTAVGDTIQPDDAMTGIQFYQPHSGYLGLTFSQLYLGPEAYDPPWALGPGYQCASNEKCRMSDAALIRYDNRSGSIGGYAYTQFPWNFNAPSSHVLNSPRYLSFAGEILFDNLIVGYHSLTKTGKQSGTTTGTVSRVCFNWPLIVRNGRLMKLICQVEVDGMYAEHGDSGSPVYWWIGDAYLAGMLWGARDDATTGHRVGMFSSMTGIRSDFSPYSGFVTY